MERPMLEAAKLRATAKGWKPPSSWPQKLEVSY